MMYGITLDEPYASLVAAGAKKFETRSWRTHYRGPLAIHAARNFPRSKKVYSCQARVKEALGGREPQPGAILAVVSLVNCTMIGQGSARSVGKLEEALGIWTPGRYAWTLANLRALPEPMYCKGGQRLWRVPPETETLINLQLGGWMPNRTEYFIRYRLPASPDGAYFMTDPLPFDDVVRALEARREQGVIDISAWRRDISEQPLEPTTGGGE